MCDELPLELPLCELLLLELPPCALLFELLLWELPLCELLCELLLLELLPERLLRCEWDEDEREDEEWECSALRVLSAFCSSGLLIVDQNSIH